MVRNTKYTIGVDFGTLSARALLVNAKTGEEIAWTQHDYTHGVMDEALPNGKTLPREWALQNASDYVEALEKTIPALLQKTGVKKEDVIGIGTDFTACTPIPVKADGTPLSELPEFADEPHAYVKLWKHHAAQYEADRINALALTMEEDWLKRYGGKVSSEWLFPKLMQILDEAPEIYEAMDFFVEAADWIVWQLTGKHQRSACAAGYKAMWNKKDGYPCREFFRALDTRLETVIEEKLDAPIVPLGQKAGELTEDMAMRLGLMPGTAVAVGNVDAHVTVPAAGIADGSRMLAIMGTSTCHMILGESEELVDGICGVVEDGILPGFFGYEAGQCCVGDHFAWLVNHFVPQSYFDEAEESGMDIHSYLSELASGLAIGESGLIALDWWNGNRSVLVDAELTGLLVGMTLRTRVEEVYRALIEATAYGTRVIVDAFKENGLSIREFVASGGIARKNPFMMQIYADVLHMPIYIAASEQGPALGSAIFGSVAAGEEAGGYDDIFTASRAMGSLESTTYVPVRENVERYELLYQEYCQLHDLFGRGGNDVMKRLKAIRDNAVAEK